MSLSVNSAFLAWSSSSCISESCSSRSFIWVLVRSLSAFIWVNLTTHKPNTAGGKPHSGSREVHSTAEEVHHERKTPPGLVLVGLIEWGAVGG